MVDAAGLNTYTLMLTPVTFGHVYRRLGTRGGDISYYYHVPVAIFHRRNDFRPVCPLLFLLRCRRAGAPAFG